jgi:Zn-finger nucleic acid-binding protein
MTEQARVKIVCPECGGPLPVEAVNRAVTCERCGHASAPFVGASAVRSGAPCPRCRAILYEGDAGRITLLGCGSCGGIFLDNEGSTHITRAHDSLIANLAERVKDRAVVRTVDTRPSELPCPSCSAPMKRVHARGVAEIDLCPSHGTWFDRGELNRVMSAYVRGNAVARDERADAEARMAAFREAQRSAIDSAETTSTVGAFGVTVGLLGILGALAGSSD